MVLWKFLVTTVRFNSGTIPGSGLIIQCVPSRDNFVSEISNLNNGSRKMDTIDLVDIVGGLF